ncbi:MAG: biofilm PGA synthesis N-glycosyltransferase PgaC [Candidatus Latescibacterota bacterium]|jgi:biofilm PGA synthesis N-glycosyltransferase PgaC
MLILLVIPILYSLVMLYYYLGIRKTKTLALYNSDQKTSFSVIIPFRNEADNLPALLTSLLNIEYPKSLYEIILVDDASEDNSAALITKWITDNKLQSNARLTQSIRASEAPKKDALQTAIALANYDWIITTDADCKVPECWLKAYDALIQKKNTVFVAGPVMYEGNNSFVEQYQFIDGLSLQAVTAGGFGQKNPILCNGANLAYKLAIFKELKGFEGNNHIASGDDIFMLEKVSRAYPKQMHYLKNYDALVRTKPEKNWMAVLNQRSRWASKTTKQKSLSVKVLGLFILSINLSLCWAPLLFTVSPIYGSIGLSIVLIKLIADYQMIKTAASILKTSVPFWHFLGSFFVYPIITILVFYSMVIPKYQWKGRIFRY